MWVRTRPQFPLRFSHSNIRNASEEEMGYDAKSLFHQLRSTIVKESLYDDYDDDDTATNTTTRYGGG